VAVHLQCQCQVGRQTTLGGGIPIQEILGKGPGVRRGQYLDKASQAPVGILKVIGTLMTVLVTANVMMQMEGHCHRPRHMEEGLRFSSRLVESIRFRL